jgi:hypothetical protein
MAAEEFADSIADQVKFLRGGTVIGVVYTIQRGGSGPKEG